jgi:predicted cytidylate kinase
MIISFSGAPGSGKSGIAKRLAEKLGWPYYDMGGLRRRFAAEQGMTLEEYNTLGESDPKTDTEVDEYQAKLGKEQDNFVIVGRTSWHFIPHSVKIYMDVDPLEGARRIFNDTSVRNEAKNMSSVRAVLENMKKRQQSDSLRYKKYFNIDVNDKSHYDFVVDTSAINQEEAFNKVCAIIEDINI